MFMKVDYSGALESLLRFSERREPLNAIHSVACREDTKHPMRKFRSPSLPEWACKANARPSCSSKL